MQSRNPKDFWKMINNLNKQNDDTKADINIDMFYDYSKNLNDYTDVENDDEYNINSENSTLDKEISKEEILYSVKCLKNNKAAGTDMVINEYIKSTIEIFIPIYYIFFNLILNSGIVPASWTIGSIVPIYKKKGDCGLPENYRPITILSCLGKLFTSIINNRLNNFVDEHNLLNETQAGFRKDYAVTDHLFSLCAIMSYLRSQKKKLFCTFIDFSKAFDQVWRIGLWYKVLNSGITGKCFNVIYNMYQDIKSSVKYKNKISATFPCKIGVRQGENLSPLLFALYLNDLEAFLLNHDCKGVQTEYYENELLNYLKIFELLYADDTVLFADNVNNMNIMLNAFGEYCTLWKLNVNIDKTKVVIFGSRGQSNATFSLLNRDLEICDSYNYLGVVFSKGCSFAQAQPRIKNQASKALHLLYSRIHNLNLPIDCQLKLFDHTILPILLNGCEIWGFGDLSPIETIHNQFLSNILKVKKKYPSVHVIW
ncbi:hypothetical protein SNE40_007689 [Patella caerulea]|uniref:Reverse transcriptase domain-containing protein n=1 Tax=Patella caerulea TaxID=87958 RepID=A0AAN8JXB6_PATCE